jgi:hypothetical protein
MWRGLFSLISFLQEVFNERKEERSFNHESFNIYRFIFYLIFAILIITNVSSIFILNRLTNKYISIELLYDKLMHSCLKDNELIERHNQLNDQDLTTGIVPGNPRK